MDESERQLKKNVTQLKKDNAHLRERVKVLDKKYDMLQDEEAKIAIEMQGLIQSMNFIMNVAIEIANREGIRKDMGLMPKDPQLPPGPPPTGGPTPPGSPPPGVT